MKRAAHRGPAQRHALVPVAGESEPLGVDDQPRSFPGEGANHLSGVVVGTIVGDQEVEGLTVLVQDGSQSLGDTTAAVETHLELQSGPLSGSRVEQ